MQLGLLQLAVMYAVPGATAVIVPGLLGAAPVLVTVALAMAEEPQVSGGLMYTPLES